MDRKTRRAMAFLRRFSRRDIEEMFLEMERACPSFLAFLSHVRTHTQILRNTSANTPRFSS